MSGGIYPGMYMSIAKWYSSLVDPRFWNLQSFSDGECFCHMIKIIDPDFDISPDRPQKGYRFENEPETEVEKKFRFVGDFIESRYNIKFEVTFLRECYEVKHETSIAVVAVFVLTTLTDFYNSRRNEAMTKLLMLEREVQYHIKECMEFILGAKESISIALLQKFLTRQLIIVATPSRSKRKRDRRDSSDVVASPFSSLEGFINSLPNAKDNAHKTYESDVQASSPSVTEKEAVVQKINESQDVKSYNDHGENHIEIQDLKLKYEAMAEKFTTKLGELELELNHEKSQASALRKENADIRNSFYQSEESISNLKNQNKALEQKMNEKERKYEDLNKRLESMKKESTSELMVSHGFEQVLEAKNREADREQQNFKSTVDQLTEDKGILETENIANRKQIKADEENIKSLIAENGKCSQRLAECEAEIESLKAEYEAAKARMITLEKAEEQRKKDIMDEMASKYKSPAKSPGQPEVIHFHEQDPDVSKYFERIWQLTDDLQKSNDKVREQFDDLKSKEGIIKNQAKELAEKEDNIKNQLAEIERINLYKPLAQLQCRTCKCAMMTLTDGTAAPPSTENEHPLGSVRKSTNKRKRSRLETPLTSTPQTMTSQDVPQNAENPYQTISFEEAKQECLEFIYSMATEFGTVEEVHPHLKGDMVSIISSTDSTTVSIMIALSIVSCITDPELKDFFINQNFMPDYSLQCLLRSVLKKGLRNFKKVKEICDTSLQNLQKLQEKEKDADDKQLKYKALSDKIQHRSKVIARQRDQYRIMMEDSFKQRDIWLEKYNKAIDENPSSLPEKCKKCGDYEKRITTLTERWYKQFEEVGQQKIELVEELESSQQIISRLEVDNAELKEEISTVKKELGPRYPVIEKKKHVLYTVRSVVNRKRPVKIEEEEGRSEDDMECIRLAEIYNREKELNQMCVKAFTTGFELEDEESINTYNEIRRNPQLNMNRLTEIQMRNFTTAPHLKSLYPTELESMTPTQKKYLAKPEFGSLINTPKHSYVNYLFRQK